MRILRLNRHRGERGATAVLVACLAIFLVGLASFTVDFGQAYVSKRQLQTATDAAALAAAAVYASDQGDCASLASLPKTGAENAADQVLSQNKQDAAAGALDVACSSDGKSLDVSIDATATTPVTLGAVFGQNHISTQRSATARVSVAQSAVGLKPYLICNFYVPDPLSPTTVTKVPYPTSADTSGACPHPAGNWFTLDCPHVGNSNNGNPNLAAATLTGCDHEVSVVSPQDPSGPSALYTSLVAACPAKSSLMVDYDSDCLTANPGNLGSGNIDDPTSIDGAWQAIVGTKGLFPVFCSTDKCNPVGYVAASPGNNAMYPIYKLVGAEICGWHWGSKNSGIYPSSDPDDVCNGADATGPPNNGNYLLMAFTLVTNTGSTNDISACALGDSGCDGLARTFYLAK